MGKDESLERVELNGGKSVQVKEVAKEGHGPRGAPFLPSPR